MNREPVAEERRRLDGRGRRGGLIAVLDGVEAIYLTVAMLCVFVLVVLRGFYSGYRVGGYALMALVILGFLVVVPFGLAAAVRRRWGTGSIVVVGGYGAAVAVIVAIDLLTN